MQKIAEIANTLRLGVIMSGHHVRSNTFNSINGVPACRRRMSRAPLLKEFGNLSNKKLVVVRKSAPSCKSKRIVTLQRPSFQVRDWEGG